MSKVTIRMLAPPVSLPGVGFQSKLTHLPFLKSNHVLRAYQTITAATTSNLMELTEIRRQLDKARYLSHLEVDQTSEHGEAKAYKELCKRVDAIIRSIDQAINEAKA